MFKKWLIEKFGKEEKFEAFVYINKDGKLVEPYYTSSRIRWLKPVSVKGLTYKDREKAAFESFKKENDLKNGQVWIF